MCIRDSFFPLSLCLAKWFWPDLMNGRHDHTTAVCVSLPSFLHFSLFSSPLPSGTCRTPGLSILSCCLPTSSSVCLVFFPLSLCLARRFWPDPMNGRHDHTTAVCVSLPWSGGLRVVRLPAGSWPSPSDEAKKRHLVAVSLLHVEERMAEKKVFSQQNIL